MTCTNLPGEEVPNSPTINKSAGLIQIGVSNVPECVILPMILLKCECSKTPVAEIVRNDDRLVFEGAHPRLKTPGPHLGHPPLLAEELRACPI